MERLRVRVHVAHESDRWLMTNMTVIKRMVYRAATCNHKSTASTTGDDVIRQRPSIEAFFRIFGRSRPNSRVFASPIGLEPIFPIPDPTFAN